MELFLNSDKLKPVFTLKVLDIRWVRIQESIQYQSHWDQSLFCGAAKLTAGYRLPSQARGSTARPQLKVTQPIISSQQLTPSVTITQWCHPKRQQKCICPSQSSLTNTCFHFSKWGVPGGALWQFDVLQVGHADHHAPAGLACSTDSLGSHFLYRQPSGGEKHQIQPERKKSNTLPASELSAHTPCTAWFFFFCILVLNLQFQRPSVHVNLLQ